MRSRLAEASRIRRRRHHHHQREHYPAGRRGSVVRRSCSLFRLSAFNFNAASYNILPSHGRSPSVDKETAPW